MDAETPVSPDAVKPPSRPAVTPSTRSTEPAAAADALPGAAKAVTVAVFAPLATLVLSRPPSADDDRMDPTSHMLLVTADTAGRICVFEHRKHDPADHP